jgi:hypothetical protein
MKRPFVASSHFGRVMFFSALLAVYSVCAHTAPVSTLTLVPEKDNLRLSLVLNPFELNFFSELDLNRDGRLDPGEWKHRGEKIARRILDYVELTIDQQKVSGTIAGLIQTYESHHITVRAHYAVDARDARIEVRSRLPDLTSQDHLTDVTFRNGSRVQTAGLDAQTEAVVFERREGEAFGSHGQTVLANDGQTLTASELNTKAVMTLLGLLCVAGLPPILFLLVFRRYRQQWGAPGSTRHALRAGSH